MPEFISCDWGTSNLRLRLVEKEKQTVLKEIETDEGIASLYNLWKKEPAGTDRFFYYMSVLDKHLVEWSTSGEHFLNTPVIVSGMASSTIGVMEMDYAQMPFPANGSALVVKKINSSKAFPFPLFIVSGASTMNDVMRGEETLLAGCDTIPGKTELFIFPGTHSKHVVVTNRIANSLATYMTGEFFDLLSRQSILAGSIQRESTNTGSDFFEKGIIDGAEMNLLNSVFRVRIHDLFKEATAAQNFHYLSGLLIGTELGTIKVKDISLITVVAGNTLVHKYLTGLKLLQPTIKVKQVDAGEALVNGHCKIISSFQ